MAVISTDLGALAKIKCLGIGVQFTAGGKQFYLKQYWSPNAEAQLDGFCLWNMADDTGYALTGTKGFGSIYEGYEWAQDPTTGHIWAASSAKSNVPVPIYDINPTSPTEPLPYHTMHGPATGMSINDDGRVVVVNYNPNYIEWRETDGTWYELLTTASTGSDIVYIWSDGTYIYGGGGSPPILYRIKVDDWATNHSHDTYTFPGATTVWVRKGQNANAGYYYAECYGVMGYSGWSYWLLNGFNTPVFQSSQPDYVPISGHVAPWINTIYPVDISGIAPDKDKNCTLSYYRSGAWHSKTLTLSVPLDDTGVMAAFPSPDNQMIFNADLYSPTFIYNPITAETTQLGYMTGNNIYRWYYSRMENEYYASGYAWAFNIYDPTEPWTRVPGADSRTTNPMTSTSLSAYFPILGHYIERVAQGTNKSVLICSTSSSTADYLIYHPETDTYDYYPSIGGKFQDVISIRGGTYFALSRAGITVGGIYLHHVRSLRRDLKKIIIPNSSYMTAGFGMLKEVGNRPGSIGHIIAMSGGNTGCKAWRIDTFTHRVVWEVSLPDYSLESGSYDRVSIEWGPGVQEGESGTKRELWFSTSGSIWSLNPTTGAITERARTAGNFPNTGDAACPQSSKFIWIGNSLYVWDNTNPWITDPDGFQHADFHVYKMSGLF